MIFLTQALWAAALLGYGTGIGNALRLKLEDDDSLLCRGLLGFASVAMLAVSLNFITGLGGYVSLSILAIGLVLFLYSKAFRMATPGDAAVATMLLFYVAMRTCRITNNYDTGLYHLQTVKWAAEAPLPFGLANLNWRFGFNSSWHPLAALMEVPWVSGQSSYILNGVLMFIFGAAGLRALKNVLYRRPSRASDFFLTLCLYPWARLLASGNVSSLSPDVAITVLVLSTVFIILRCGETVVEARRERWIVLAITSVFAVTVKFAALPLLIAPLIGWLLRMRQPRDTTREGSALAVAFPTAIFATWAVRGVCLTGGLLFPVVQTHFTGLPWALPAEVLSYVRGLIHDWARLPGGEPKEWLQNGQWLRPWAERTLLTEDVLAAAACLILGAGLFAVFRKRSGTSLASGMSLAVGVAAIGVFFWFLTAPDLRFGLGFIFALGLVVLAFGLEKASHNRAIRAGVCATVLGLVVLRGGLRTTLPQASLVNWPSQQSIECEQRRLNNGEIVNVPKYGDQCWNSPLPCAPSTVLNPDLRIQRDESGKIRLIWIGAASQQ
ncbi:MAG TPA: hypothetical protein VEJ63_09915 [Planctomycetota bacterium]|nr:hypothetical protein [Planctomycetota bacterium]